MKINIQKVGTLLSLAALMAFSPISSANAASTYRVNTSIKGYMNAQDASRGTNSTATYAAGNYYVYKTHNGMINISRVAGSPGVWINPSTNTATTTTTTTNTSSTNSGTYKLTASTAGYTNAADAQARRNQRSTLAAGDYHVFRTYNGMINITRVKGVPGAWINPNSVSSTTTTPMTPTQPTTPSTTTTANTYTLTRTLSGYTNAADAKAGRNATSSRAAGTYFIFRSYDGMLNLTTKQGVPGVWVNPNQSTTTTTTTTTPSTSTSTSTTSPKVYTLSQFRWMGVINWSGKKYTYYSQSVLPGYGLSIPGRHVNADGYVADKDGYIVLAAARSIAKGTVVDTPFGYKGKVYDTCPECSITWFDVYIR